MTVISYCKVYCYCILLLISVAVWFISQVRGSDILLVFSEKFHSRFRGDEEYDVMFTFSRSVGHEVSVPRLFITACTGLH